MMQLNPCAKTTEPAFPRACAPQREKPPEQEARILQLESSHQVSQLGEVRAATNGLWAARKAQRSKK